MGLEATVLKAEEFESAQRVISAWRRAKAVETIHAKELMIYSRIYDILDLMEKMVGTAIEINSGKKPYVAEGYADVYGAALTELLGMRLLPRFIREHPQVILVFQKSFKVVSYYSKSESNKVSAFPNADAEDLDGYSLMQKIANPSVLINVVSTLTQDGSKLGRIRLINLGYTDIYGPYFRLYRRAGGNDAALEEHTLGSGLDKGGLIKTLNKMLRQSKQQLPMDITISQIAINTGSHFFIDRIVQCF